MDAALYWPPAVCFPRRGTRGVEKTVLEQELSRDVAEAAAELLQVLCCGEESAVLAFARLSRNAVLDRAAAACAAAIAAEEMVHDELLRGLRLALPVPRPDAALPGELRRFYRALSTPDAFVHLTQICALDSGVCLILSALRGAGRPVGRNPTLDALFGRIQRDEVGHVRASGRLARLCGSQRQGADLSARTRESLAGLVLRRADALETLEVDPDALRRSLVRVPAGRR